MDAGPVVTVNITLQLRRIAFTDESTIDQSAKILVDVVEQLARDAFGQAGFSMSATVARDYSKTYVHAAQPEQAPDGVVL